MWIDAGTASALLPKPIDLCEFEPDLPCDDNNDPFTPTTSIMTAVMHGLRMALESPIMKPILPTKFI